MVTLHPYNHQLGGHSLMFQVNKEQICKLFRRKEKLFYDLAPDVLKEFIPEFYGMMNVQFDSDEETGEVKYTGRVIDDCHCVQYTSDEEERKQLCRLKLSKKNDTDTKLKINIDTEEANSYFANPWIEKSLKDLSKKILPKETHDFMILENLTGPYLYPCQLELKLGTRTHTSDMSPRRIKKHIEKAHTTTLSVMGLRFVGMQLYDSEEKCYQEKYGYSFTQSMTCDIIKSFVYDNHNGRYHTEIVGNIVKKLVKLRHVISQLNYHRFYSSSVLIIYEGGHKETSKQTSVGVYMIDFQKFINDPLHCDNGEGPDEGCMLGLTNLISILEELI